MNTNKGREKRRPIYLGGGARRQKVAHGHSLKSHRLSVAGVARRYRTLLPTEYAPSIPVPIVLAFHGEGGTPAALSRVEGLRGLASSLGAILVFPEGRDRDWSVATDDEDPGGPEDKDIAFIKRLLSLLPDIYPVDKSRILALGFSKGGEFVYRFACEAGNSFCAIVVIAATLGECRAQPMSMVPVIHIHGTQDRVYPFSGVPEGAFGGYKKGVPETIDTWLRRNGLDNSTESVEQIGNVTLFRCGSIENGVAPVEFLMVEGLGHTWPSPAVIRELNGDMDCFVLEKELKAFIEKYASGTTGEASGNGG